MIYSILLVLHSLLRWFVLVSLLYAVYRAYKGWFTDSMFTPHDSTVQKATVTIAHLQFLVGLGLYAVSPVIRQLFGNFGEAVQQSSIRFYGMEHSLMMLIAIVLITIGSARAKRKPGDSETFKTLAVWFTVALLIILVMIPWPFSPMDARPWFRIS